MLDFLKMVKKTWNRTKTYSHDDKYTGMWKNGKREGKGTGIFQMDIYILVCGKMANLKVKEH